MEKVVQNEDWQSQISASVDCYLSELGSAQLGGRRQ